MDNTTNIALSRLDAQQRAMDVIANNIANASTPGYKAERTLFSDWLSPQNGTTMPAGDRMLAYTQDRATYRDQSAGALNQTGNPLDIAINGDGFFTVQTAQGVRLTRAGRFSLLQDGTIADQNGNALLDPLGHKLVIAPGDTGLTISGDGTIETSSGTIGKIAVVRAKDFNSLQAQGSRLFDTGSGVTPAANPKLVQGALESSNVQPVLEVTRMMTQMREFQFMTQFVQAESTRMQDAIAKITKPN